MVSNIIIILTVFRTFEKNRRRKPLAAVNSFNLFRGNGF